MNLQTKFDTWLGVPKLRDKLESGTKEDNRIRRLAIHNTSLAYWLASILFFAIGFGMLGVIDVQTTYPILIFGVLFALGLLCYSLSSKLGSLLK